MTATKKRPAKKRAKYYSSLRWTDKDDGIEYTMLTQWYEGVQGVYMAISTKSRTVMQASHTPTGIATAQKKLIAGREKEGVEVHKGLEIVLERDENGDWSEVQE